MSFNIPSPPNDIPDSLKTWCNLVKSRLEHMPNIVLNADLGNMPTNTIKGNVRSVTSPPQDITLADFRTFLGVLPVSNGGTGTNALSTNNVILGNGTSAVQFVAPGTSGNVLMSNGTTWQSTALPGVSVTQTAGTSASINFSGLDFTSNIGYEIFINNLVPATTNTDFKIQVSKDGGSNYLDASVGRASVNDNGSGVSNLTTGIIFTGMKNASPNANFYGVISQPLTSTNCMLAYTGAYTNNSSIGIGVHGNNTYATTTNVTDIKFIQSSGNITTGTITIKPIAR